MSIDSNASFRGGRDWTTSLPNWLRSKVTPHEGWLLWVLQSHYPNIFPSLTLLAKEAGMSRSMVAKLLGGFEQRGWLRRQQTFRDDGRKANTRYELTIWDLGRPVDWGVVHTVDVSSPPRGLGLVHGVDVDSPQGGHKEDQSKKYKKTFRETPPLSPRWGEAPQAAPDGQARSGQLAPIPSQQPQPAQAPAAITSPSSSALPVPSGDVPPAWPQEAQQGASAAPVLHSPAETPTAASAGQLGHDPSRSGSETVAPRKPRDPFASKVLPLDVVPDNLLDCQQLLAEWWEVKTRGRTRNAFLRACAFLSEQPQSDRRQILERAVIGGYQGLHPLPAQVTRQRGRGEYSPLETARQATAMVQRFEAAVAEDPDAAFF